MSRPHYYEGLPGHYFVYDSDASWCCPYAEEVSGPAVPEVTPMVDALQALVGDRINVRLALHRAHRSSQYEEDSKVCRNCGARRRKLGYRTWKEFPIADVEANEATVRINQRLGGTHLRVPGSHRYWPTKREAMAWAREEAAIERLGAEIA